MPVGPDTHGYRRDLPHLEKSGKTYFVTFCTRARIILSPSARTIALECCIHDHQVTYWLHCAVVMPDHAHLLFTAFAQWSLATINGRVKGVSSHLINKRLQRHGHLWQHESFDRILRTDESIRKTSEYICENPVRAGLVAHADAYQWLWREWIEGKNSASAS